MKHILAIVAAVGLVLAFLPANQSPRPVVVTPQSGVSSAMQRATKQDRERVSAFYSALSDVVERDGGAINTVGEFRTLHAKSLDLAFKGTDLPGKYTGLDLAINDHLVAAVGTGDVPLQPARRSALVQALKDVANAAR